MMEDEFTKLKNAIRDEMRDDVKNEVRNEVYQLVRLENFCELVISGDLPADVASKKINMPISVFM